MNKEVQNEILDRLQVLKERQDLIMYLIQAVLVKLGSDSQEINAIIDTINNAVKVGDKYGIMD